MDNTIMLKELVKEMAKESGLPQYKMKAAVYALEKVVKDAVINDDSVLISNFGIFAPVTLTARVRRDFTTGTYKEIPTHKVLRWRPAKAVKRAVNEE